MNYQKALKLLKIKTRKYTYAQVKKQYRILSKKNHPDMNPNNEKKYNKIFMDIKKAYNFLIKSPIRENLAIPNKPNTIHSTNRPPKKEKNINPEWFYTNKKYYHDYESDDWTFNSSKSYRPCDYCKTNSIKRYMYKGSFARDLFDKKSMFLCETCFYRFNTTVCNLCGKKLQKLAKVYFRKENDNKLRFNVCDDCYDKESSGNKTTNFTWVIWTLLIIITTIGGILMLGLFH